MSKNIISLSVCLILVAFLFAGFNAYAAEPTTPTTPSTTTPSTTTPSTSSGTKTSTATLNNPLGAKDLTVGQLIGRIVKSLMGIVGVVAVLMIVWGGIMYMTSAGNDEKIGTAKKIITGAIIGLAISILAYTLVDFVIKAIGG